MKERIKKILFINLLLVVLMLFSVSSVFAYEFVNPDNEFPVKRERKYIYIFAELYYDIIGRNSNSFSTMNYNGVCNTVTIQSGEYTGSYALEEYIAGVVSQEIGGANFEAQKAQAIAARSYLIGQMKNSSTCTIENSQSFQTFRPVDSTNQADQQFIKAAQETAGMVVMYNGNVFITYYSSSPANASHNVKGTQWQITLQKDATPANQWTWTGPSKSEVCKYAYCAMDGRGHSWGMSQIVASYLAAAENYSYEKILELFYKFNDNYSIGILSDGNYVGDIAFVDSEFGKIRYFNQGNFANYYYSSDVSKPQYKGSSGSYATIKSHGCGPTSLAIVFSSFAGKDISPITTTQEVCKLGGCYSSGSSFTTLKKLADNYGYKTKFTSSPSEVTTALASKNSLVIALMGPGDFTDGGHYIVLTGTRSDGSVSVADPGSNSRTEQKWFSFNTVVEQSKHDFLIITR